LTLPSLLLWYALDRSNHGSQLSDAQFGWGLLLAAAVTIPAWLVGHKFVRGVYAPSPPPKLVAWLSSALTRPDRSALPVDGDDWFVPYHPSVVAGGQGHDFTGTCVDLGSVLHGHVNPPGQLVLLVRRHAELGAGHRLDVLGPPPSWLKGNPADLDAPGKVDQLHPPVLTFPNLVRLVERHMLERLGHGCSYHVSVPPRSFTSLVKALPP
jgi:hypothetical protein